MSIETLFDSHSHLHFSQYDKDREEIIKKLRDFDIKTINIGTDFKESEKAIALAEKCPDLMRASVGLHPNDNSEENFNIDKYRELAKNKNVVAIGECGLDYYYLKSQISNLKNKELQKEIFKEQIGLAKELNKPIILHCRPSIGTQDAYNDALDILVSCFKFHVSRISGVAHFFVGSKEIAKKFLELGFYISFAGPITFASEYREVVEFVPLDRILVETDAPFAAPVPHRGKRNEPAFVEFVARQVAQWQRLSFEEVARQTTKNAKKLFNINFE